MNVASYCGFTNPKTIGGPFIPVKTPMEPLINPRALKSSPSLFVRKFIFKRKMTESVRTLTPIINPNNRVGNNPHGKSKKDE